MQTRFNKHICEIFIRFFLAAALVAGSFVALEPSRAVMAASTLIVNTAADENDGSCSDGDCSLRDAIQVAAANDTITFESSMTITLGSVLTVDKDLTIDGGTNTVTISGNDAVHMFNIPATTTAEINHLTLTGLSAGLYGAVYNLGSLTVNECIFTNNYNSSIYNAGTVTVTNSAFTNNHAPMGGAIANEGTMTIIGSTISGNTAGFHGGGIMNSNGSLTLINSTISGNTAQGYMSGNGSGGGILNHSVLTLINSTVSGNIGGVGGGISSSGTLNYRNTILANNSGGDCSVSGSIGTSSYNLVEDGSCSNGAVNNLSGDPKLGPLADNGGIVLTHALLAGSPAIDAGDDTFCPATDQRGEARPQNSACDIGSYEAGPQPVLRLAKSVTPTVNVLENGVVTYTITLNNIGEEVATSVILTDTLPGEVAFNAWEENPGATVTDGVISWDGTVGTSSVLTFVFTATSTAGANEIVTNSVEVTSTEQIRSAAASFMGPCHFTAAVTSNADSGPGSLRQAIAEACPDGEITFSTDTTILLNGALTIDKNLLIDGSLALVTVNGNNNGGVFNIAAKNNVTLSHLIITGSNFHQGAIQNFGTLTIINSVIFDNNSFMGVGGIYNDGTLNMNNCTIAYNTSGMGADGMANHGLLNFHNTIISLNGWANCSNSGTIGENINNLVQNGECSDHGVNFLSSDPLFINAGSGNFRLRHNSPAVNTGNPPSLLNLVDMDGRPRIIDGIVDRGAYEFQSFTLTINQIGNGSVISSPATLTYNYSEQTVLSATPDLGWSFAGWSGDFTSSDSPATITLFGNTSVTATFVDINDAPVIVKGASTTWIITDSSSPVVHELLLKASDLDATDTLTWSMVETADHGTASASGTGTSQTVNYTPEAGYSGNDSFVVQVSDGQGGIDTIVIYVQVKVTDWRIFLPMILRVTP